MRVGSIVREPLAIQRLGSRGEQRATVRRLIEEVGLPRDAVNRYPHEFSGGQRQRIGLARALALNPTLIVADEPVSALDVSIRSQVLNLMRELQRHHDLTYIVISHDLTVVRYVSDLLGVMYLGKLVETGDSEAVYGSPAHPYTAALIATIPLPDPVHERSKTHAAIRGEIPSATSPPTGCRFHTRCPRAQDVCRAVEPPLRSFGGTHLAACHFPLQEPAASEAAA
jgi:peptide/nickel transport system ATP-binding protein